MSAQGHVSPVQAASVDGVAAATVLFRRRGRLHLSIIAKATFVMVPGGAMRLVAPLPLRRDEAPDPRGTSRSIRAPGELSPYLTRADILFVGHAHPPQGKPVTQMRARLSVLRGGAPLLDKQLHVFGDRVLVPGRPAPEGEPFSRMPLVYDRAFGGIGSPENPLGVGFQPDPAGHLPLPNVMYPDGARARQPAGFGPVSWFLPARRRLAAGASRAALDALLVNLPDDLDDAYFQAAPVDQQTSFLHGDEHIVLEGLHPVHHVFRTALPPVRAVAAAATPGGQRPVALMADTLFLDGDAGVCTITWRGALLLPAERPLDGLVAVVGLQQAGRYPWWPAVPAPAAGRPGAAELSAQATDYTSTVALPEGAPPPAQPKPAHVSTLELDVQAQWLAAALATTPFSGSPEAAGAEQQGSAAGGAIPGAPWSDEPSLPLPVSGPSASTVEVDIEAVLAAMKGTADADPRPTLKPAANADPGPVLQRGPKDAVEGASPPAVTGAVGEREPRQRRASEPGGEEGPWRKPAPEPAEAERAPPAAPRPEVKGLFYGRFKKG